MDQACFFKNTTGLASATQLNLHEQKQHAGTIMIGRLIKNNFTPMRIILFILPLLFLFANCSKKVEKAVQSCKVKKGVFDIEVAETGEVAAVNAININSPAMSWRYGQQKIIKIVEDGSEVKKGDTVIVFDPSEVQKVISDAKAELEIANAELQKTLAEQELKLDELEADLKSASLSYDISRIELELASYESEIQKKEIQLNLDKAKLDLEKASQVITNQRKINVEDINQSNVKIRQLVNNVEEANKTLKNLTVTSPANGIAIIRRNWSTNNKFQVGDQTWSGNAMIDLPDLSQLKAIAKINEVDISKIKVKQKSFIRLDAFSDTTFSGSVTSIANLAVSKSDKTQKIKVFPVEILIHGTSKLLMPGMTVNVKVIVDKLPNVLYIPLEATFKKDNVEYVFVKKGTSFEKRVIETGKVNNDYIIIAKGLEEGDVLALADPFEKKEDTAKPNNKKD
jgi:multidrug resistance efflux pump